MRQRRLAGKHGKPAASVEGPTEAEGRAFKAKAEALARHAPGAQPRARTEAPQEMAGQRGRTAGQGEGCV